MNGHLIVHTPKRSLIQIETYPDEGCEYSPKMPDGSGGCLGCPLPQCRYDVKQGIDHFNHVKLRGDVVRLKASGKAPQLIADELSITRRHVYRLLAESRN